MHSFIIIIMIASITLSTLIVFLVLRKRQRTMQKAIGNVMEPPGAFGSSRTSTGTYEGTEYKYEYFAGSRNAPSYFKIKVECPSSGSFKIAKETRFDRFFKKLGLCCEIKTGDDPFDDSFYVTTDTVDFTQAFFSSAEKRAAISDIYERGFNKISHDGKAMTAMWSPFQTKNEVDMALITEIVSRLIVLTKDMPVLPLGGTVFGESGWKFRRILAFAIPALIGLIGINALVFGIIKFRPLDGWQIAVASLQFSIPLLVISLWIAVMLIKGRSSSHRELIIILVISVFGFPLTGAGLGIFLNGWLDESDASSHTVVVVSKYVSESDKSTSYYAVLESWREERRTEKLRISSYEYRKVVPHTSEITVTTKPGRFGFEWVIGHTLHASSR